MSSKGCGRRVRNEAEARACLDAAASSGLSLRDWARQRGFDGRSVHAWALNLGRRREVASQASAAPPVPNPRFVELFTTPVQPAPVYLVHVGDLRIEVPANFDAEVLRRLVVAVAAC